MSEENPIAEPEEKQTDAGGENQSNEKAAPRKRRWFSGRNVTIAAAIPLVLILLLALAAYLFVRLGYAGRYIEANFVVQMEKFGVRTEIGQFEQTFSPLGTKMHDVKFYDKETGELLAKANLIQLDATVTDLLAPNLNRTIRLDSTEVAGLEAWVTFDEQGRSNFSRLRVPEQEESNLRFTYETMKFLLRDSVIHYGDAKRKLSGEARNVRLFIEPQEGLSESEAEIENRRFKFDVSASNSNFTFDDKPIEPVDVSIKGVATETYAEIAEMKLTTPFANSTLSGRLENWEHLKYKLNIVSTIDLQRTQETFKTEQALRGMGNFSGVVEGEGLENYTITGEVNSEALAADNVRLQGLRANASVTGNPDSYEANGKAVADMLNAGDFRLDFLQIAGKVMGTGTDFRWLGDLRAAAGRIPGGGRISDLVLSDAVAEYRDSKITADVGNVSAGAIDAFDAKFRNLRASRAKVRNANGVTNATAANLRADSLQTKQANLRGVSASDLKIQNREGGATNVDIGRLNAANIQTEDANIQNLNAAGVNLTAQKDGGVIASADNVTASNLSATGANVRDLRAAGVDINSAGATTNVSASNLQVGGVTTNQAVLGSLNIAGVRLKIVGERIEGSSGDINAGDVILTKSADLPEGGRLENVRAARPVFVIEPSGRYRASADLSLGGGVLGSIRVGAATAAVTATSGQVDLRNLNAQIMEGNVNGNATITYEGRAASRINANFENLDIGKLLALSGGQVVPLAGRTNGTVDLTFPGLDYKSASGTLNADVVAEAGSDERGRVPVNGRIGLRATNGLFDIETANFKTEKSEVNASGRFDLSGENSNLQISLDSTDAKELQNLIAVLNVSPELDKQLAANNIELAGNFSFAGTLTGNLENPTVNGRANLESIKANNRVLGSLSTDLLVQDKTVALSNGKLEQPDGGNVAFDVSIPNGDTNNIAINATLNKVDLSGILAALPAESVPSFLKNTTAKASGKINLTGVPNNLNGTAEINSDGGTIAGEQFDELTARVNFQNSNILIERLDARAGEGTLTVRGNYDNANSNFNLTAKAENLPLERFRGFFGENPPNIAGTINFTATGTGSLAYTKKGKLDFSGVDVNFNGTGSQIAVDQRQIGEVSFVGKTQNQQLTANVTANLNGQQQTILASLNFGDETLPFRAETVFNNTDLTPYVAIFREPSETVLGGRVTGTATFGGNLRSRNEKGELVFSTANLRGEANLSGLTLQVEDVVLSTAEPTRIQFSSSAVTIDNARFVGSGSNIVVNGTAVFAGEGMSNLAVEGTINLRVLNFISNNQFFGGLANVSVRLMGTANNARLTGAATLDNANFTTIISNQRTTFTNIKGRVLFTTNQAQIERLEARLGGGTIVASGGILFDNKLNIDAYRLDVRGDDVTARLPSDFRTAGDAVIQISGRRAESGVFNSKISGEIFATRAEYFRDFDVADLITSRRTSSISAGTGDPALGVPQLDLRIVGRNALVVRNNVADLTGSIDVRILGDVNEPIVSGRITATGGSIVLLNDTRYDITRATVDFPAQLDAAPIVNFQGEADIAGYQVFLSAAGEISDVSTPNITLRSNPALPQADVVSLVTTGSLTNAEGGIGTFAQTGLNTAADLITDAVINQPIRKATDRLFGLNRFELSPVLAGQRGINPGARLTVGRQINRNLLVTYSTNLSEDRNQVLALEYRVSNRISVVAQYEQVPVSNVTRRRDNFSFEVRFRKRF